MVCSDDFSIGDLERCEVPSSSSAIFRRLSPGADTEDVLRLLRPAWLYLSSERRRPLSFLGLRLRLRLLGLRRRRWRWRLSLRLRVNRPASRSLRLPCRSRDRERDLEWCLEFEGLRCRLCRGGVTLRETERRLPRSRLGDGERYESLRVMDLSRSP